jgi:nitrite reductase/ring-hydroxylating ferredoxin subunit
MAEWKAAGAENMLADGAMTEVALGDARVLLARVQGQYYALQARCTHLGGILASGKLSDFVVRCPRHGSQFDLRDGHVVAWIPKIPGIAHKMAEAVKKPESLRTYHTQVKDGQVWVETD